MHWRSHFLNMAFAMAAASCGGVEQAGGTPDASMHPAGDASLPDAQSGASSACKALAACCQSGRFEDPAACASVALSGSLTSAGCSMELSVYQANGLCPMDAGSSRDVRSFVPDVIVSPPPSMDVFIPPSDVFIPPPPPPNEGGTEGGAPPTLTCTPACAVGQVCNQFPGLNAACTAPCQSDDDCPGLTTCTSAGTCSYQCSTCPAGQTCEGFGGFPGNCSSNDQCSLGTFCSFGMCQGYQSCIPCNGGCPQCISNSQCNQGQVCVNHACVTCSSNSQCGSSATAACTATHAGMQCTCTGNGDCATGSCQQGLCGPAPATGCQDGFQQCTGGQACINDVCGPCSTFADCNQLNPGAGREGPSGLACINGSCGACTANSQCGGGMACVGGTCGTCSTNAQCGTSGQCSDGFCLCTSAGQCAAGQRCGAGVCVSM